MAKYRKKAVEIEAENFTYPPSMELLKFCGEAITNIRKDRCLDAVGYADIQTLEDGPDAQVKHVATEGDYIIKGVQGEFYPIKPNIFKLTYDEI